MLFHVHVHVQYTAPTCIHVHVHVYVYNVHVHVHVHLLMHLAPCTMLSHTCTHTHTHTHTNTQINMDEELAHHLAEFIPPAQTREQILSVRVCVCVHVCASNGVVLLIDSHTMCMYMYACTTGHILHVHVHCT